WTWSTTGHRRRGSGIDAVERFWRCKSSLVSRPINHAGSEREPQLAERKSSLSGMPSLMGLRSHEKRCNCLVLSVCLCVFSSGLLNFDLLHHHHRQPVCTILVVVDWPNRS